MSDHAEDLVFALRCAEEAAERIRRIRADGFQVGAKRDHTLVTTADLDVNHWFIDRVRERSPSDGVLGEEASHPAAGPRTWVIDPVDGTQQFVLGIPVFMVSIALVEHGVPVVGVAANPSTGEIYRAAAGRGAYRNDERLAVSVRDGATDPAIVAGGGAVPSQGGLDADSLLHVTTGPPVDTAPVRFPWPTVFSGCKVAEGSWDGDLYGHASAHDVAAVCVLVREAGGRVTDRHGRDQRYDAPVDGCVVSNGLVHDELIARWRP
ncbi:inositol monophosphatase [Pseudonocardia sp. DSM 110487]|uniref:inositol monophosphatase family protein n=1 Tax=Pseudonocardia sp. DSM 110487 TaxID=2865833 RepID=UPI001C6A77AA|nr:inositol monophosphatase [Pseudonocardia sp. DSM 110487]QYN32028.1 inositol monophosphatase [Pseudonocardia sp. DSM 110487]